MYRWLSCTSRYRSANPMGLNVLDWLLSSVLSRDFIAGEDFHLLRVCDQPDEAVDIIQSWYTKQEIVGREALLK